MGDGQRWRDPIGNRFGKIYWPAGVERAYTIEAYGQAFSTRGYGLCEDGDFEGGFEKIAL